MELEKNAQKSHQNLSWGGLGLHFGRVRDGLGPLLDALGWLLAGSWPFLGRSKSSFVSALALDGLQDAFWSDFEIDFGRDSGGFGEDLGGSKTKFLMTCGRFWNFLSCFVLAGEDSLNRTPALIREASQFLNA